ncbi:lanthionine synthetase LanC family protein [Flavobacterium sp. HJSW_4]|uniref:lanthionine synthetase LanC family protein n=1 Tax=Flavobacterium sp. HJSW_4 TaxID=3344660 RepID=UPI0035F4D45F
MKSLEEKDILLRAETFSNLILNSSLEELVEISEKNNKTIEQYLVSNNVENIETGVSGFLLFLLEFYKSSKKDIYLKKIEMLSKSLIIYCKENTTNNYSLYSGRSGFVYFLIQLYHINKDEAILEECENLIIPAEMEYLESNYTSDYLYNGRSGTLLVLNELFQLTQSEKIFGLINKFTNVIISNAILTEKGISWKADEEINLRNSCGFAMGASGIQFVLKNICLCFPNESFNYVIEGINKYKQSCWDEEKQNWLNYEKDIINSTVLDELKKQYKTNEKVLYKPSNELSWSKGSLGILLADCHAKKIFFELDIDKAKEIPRNIYDGLSGIGLSLLENNTLKNREQQVELIKDIIVSQQMPIELQGGLFFGELGACYFLLRTLTTNKYYNSIINPCEISNPIPTKYVLNINLKLVKKSLLSKTYDKTIFLIEKIFDEQLNEFLDISGHNVSEIVKFEEFVKNQFIKVDTTINNVIADVFIFEKRRKEFCLQELRTNLEVCLDKLDYNEKIIKILNNSDEWILNQKLKISNSVKLVNTEWDWELKEDFNFIQNFYKERGFYEFLFHHHQSSVIEYPLQIDGLVLHRFDHPKKIIDASMEIKTYCQSSPEDMVKEFAKSSGSKDIQDFIKRLDFLVLHKVKQFMYDGILEIA